MRLTQADGIESFTSVESKHILLDALLRRAEFLGLEPFGYWHLLWTYSVHRASPIIGYTGVMGNHRWTNVGVFLEDEIKRAANQGGRDVKVLRAYRRRKGPR